MSLSREYSHNEIKDICNRHGIHLRYKNLTIRLPKDKNRFHSVVGKRIKFFFSHKEGLFKKASYIVGRGPESKLSFEDKQRKYMCSYTLVIRTPWGKRHVFSNKNLKALFASIAINEMPYKISKKTLYVPYNAETLRMAGLLYLRDKLANQKDNGVLEVSGINEKSLNKYWLTDKKNIDLVAVENPTEEGFTNRIYVWNQKDMNKLKLSRFHNIHTLFVVFRKNPEKSWKFIENFCPAVLDFKHSYTTATHDEGDEIAHGNVLLYDPDSEQEYEIEHEALYCSMLGIYY